MNHSSEGTGEPEGRKITLADLGAANWLPWAVEPQHTSFDERVTLEDYQFLLACGIQWP